MSAWDAKCYACGVDFTRPVRIGKNNEIDVTLLSETPVCTACRLDAEAHAAKVNEVEPLT